MWKWFIYPSSYQPPLTSAQWYVPICSLFNGRLVDKLETPMPETPETSGGEVEHEVFLFGNLILLVINLKFTLTNAWPWDHYAQVLLELVCETSRLLHHTPHLMISIKLQ